MAFTWNPTPSAPVRTLPQPVPPGQVTYQVHAVANTVDYGGAVRYNTANRSYDIVYEFPSLNVNIGIFENGFFESMNVGRATLNVADINQARINTSNITNATITFAYVTGDPTANMGIASKAYVDNAVASISGGTGPDSTANLFLAQGDLLVGIAPNTANRLPVGNDAYMLQSTQNAALKQTWTSTSAIQRAVGVSIGTHHHPTKKLHQLLLKSADSIIMQDGETVAGWSNLIADIQTTGAGGLDSSSALAASTWYEVYAIRNSSTGTKALLLHRMKNRSVAANWPATAISLAYLRRGITALTIPGLRYITKVSQSFVPTFSGPLSSIDLRVQRTGTPQGNCWITIQPDDLTGNASGTVLCTSDSLPVDLLSTSSGQVRFVFYNTTNLVAGERYHLVAEGDFSNALADVERSIGFSGNNGPIGPGQQSWMANVGYTSGNLTIMGYGDCRVWNVVTSRWSVAANMIGIGQGPSDLWFGINLDQNETALSLPSGYDQYALISYACTNASGNFKPYKQHHRTMTMGFELDWRAFTATSTGYQPIDISSGVPPIDCTVQFLTKNPNAGFAGQWPLGGRYSFDLGIDTGNMDTKYYGQYAYGFSAFRPGYAPAIVADQWNYMYTTVNSVALEMALYTTTITF
jgi:hypothetical protein